PAMQPAKTKAAKPGEARLTIQDNPPVIPGGEQPIPVKEDKPGENREIPSPRKEPQPAAPANAAAGQAHKEQAEPAVKIPSKPLSAKTGRLENIRKQIADKSLNAEKQQAIPLDKEKLQEAWQQYSLRLREHKDPALQSFEI